LTETELLRLLDAHDSLVQQCVSGGLSLDEFLSQYDNFPFTYALDGHESGLEEKEVLGRHASRISFHFGVMSSLSGLCSDEEARNPLFIKAGRFPPSVALQRLKSFAQAYVHSDG
jgi:hypothetical protein